MAERRCDGRPDGAGRGPGRSPGRGQGGETLIESLVALTVITVVGLAAFAGLWAAVTASVGHDTAARGQTMLRAAAEWLQSPDTPYLSRAGCDGSAGYTLPEPTSADHPGLSVAVTGVQFWSDPPPATESPLPTSATVSFADACPATDRGLQRITLTATGEGSTDRLVVVKRRP